MPFEIGIDIDEDIVTYDNYNKEECFLLATFLFCLIWKYENQNKKNGKKIALEVLDFIKKELEKKTNQDIEEIFSDVEVTDDKNKIKDLRYIG